MSDFTTAARPYANAVYDIASETSTLDSWGDALANLATVVNDAQMSELLSNPETGKQQKGELVIQVLGDKLNEQQRNLVKLMAENGRLIIMQDVQEQFEVARAKAENKIEAEVVSAFELSEQQTDELINTLKNKLGCDITLTTTIDESLIGGVIIKAGDTIIDASMKSQLDSLALSLGR
ncbi:MAG: F0F1 ATP synthase subunit delta [Gammaproteobacteria bacterium]|nr:F0F1 ATP synthase subunit delta [Gammaproteobacteria bacterium]MCK4834102.1 F0F1 ATP synthase subunit delta [Gammaproteobacteria bacterium]